MNSNWQPKAYLLWVLGRSLHWSVHNNIQVLWYIQYRGLTCRRNENSILNVLQRAWNVAGTIRFCIINMSTSIHAQNGFRTILNYKFSRSLEVAKSITRSFGWIRVFPEQHCYQTQQFIGICFFPFCVTYEHGLISMLSRTSKGHFLKKIVSFRPRELEMLKASGIRGKKATVHKHNIMIKGILLRMRLCLVVNH